MWQVGYTNHYMIHIMITETNDIHISSKWKYGVLGENALVFGFISKIRRLKNTAVQQVDFTLKTK